MIAKKCGYSSCNEQVVLEKDNTSGIVYFDGKYYHKDCFIKMCNSRMGNNRSKKYNWQDVLDSIEGFQKEARHRMKETIDKDNIYHFILNNYRVSCVNTLTFTKLDAIYNGTYKGLAYPIGPEELLDEWQLYYPRLLDIRKYKNMDRDQAISYDLAILLGKNAEYREYIEKKKTEEIVKQAQKNSNDEIDTTILNGSVNISRGNRRLSGLYDDVMGDEK